MIDPSADRAVYRQVADDLRDQIADRRLVPGQALRSEAAMAFDYGVGQRTVRQALHLLEGEGLIERRAGRTARVRVVEGRRDVRLARGSRVSVRRPTAAERREHRLAAGELLVEIDLYGRVSFYPSDRVVLTTA